jgi:hypothetical protein
VVDANHLERHLALNIEILAQDKPMVVALNMSDEDRHKGIEIKILSLLLLPESKNARPISHPYPTKYFHKDSRQHFLAIRYSAAKGIMSRK